MIIIQIAGRLGRDAETRFTPGGQKVTTLTVATNVRKGGKDETVWWRVTLWGDRFDKILPYLKKGTALIIVGEMGKPEIWTDKEGRPQISLDLTAEIVRFSPFGNPDRQQEQAASPGHAAPGVGTSFTSEAPGGEYNTQRYSAFGGGNNQGVLSGQANHFPQGDSADEDPLPF